MRYASGFNNILRKRDPGHAPEEGAGWLVVITTAKGTADLVLLENSVPAQ